LFYAVTFADKNVFKKRTLLLTKHTRFAQLINAKGVFHYVTAALEVKKFPTLYETWEDSVPNSHIKDHN
jgi:hypothetical protein